MSPPFALWLGSVEGESVDVAVEQHVEGLAGVAVDGVSVGLDPQFLEERLVGDPAQ
ncbi:hypothetical protein [Brevibacterium aurantiacum]|uniref:hypothetical protein n=1 Tax=Brevibacterium aurantiacum TaxID=273384 RepID=UPI0015E11E6F|nr:hypothetical protein [Brevibacterium aurantiacum]